MLLVVAALLVFAYFELLEEKKFHQECKDKLEKLNEKLEFSSLQPSFDQICDQKLEALENRLQVQLNRCTSRLEQIKTSIQTVQEKKGEKCEGMLCSVFQTVYGTINDALQ